MIKRSLSFVLAAAVAAVLSSPAGAQTLDGKAAFQKLKGLAGTWSGPIGSADGSLTSRSPVAPDRPCIRHGPDPSRPMPAGPRW